jgi:heavy metal sensor kinase
MKPLSLRVKIVGMFVLLYGTLFAVLLIWMIRHVERDFILEVDRGLAETMTELRTIVGQGHPAVDSLHTALTGASNIVALARNIRISERGRLFYTCDDFPSVTSAELEPPYSTIRHGSDWFRLHNATMGAFTVTIAERITAVEHTIEESWLLLLFSIPIVILISIAGGSYVLRRLLRPMDDIMLLARKISTESLDQRIPMPAANDEVSRLVSTLNGMIERLQLSFAQLEQFSANAAHELRTPLTILRSELTKAAEAQLTAEQYRQKLYSSLEEVLHISKTVDNLFMLARIDGRSIDMEFSAVELHTLLEEVVRGCEHLATESAVTITLEVHSAVEVYGDSILLLQLLLNLVDNAIKYNRHEGTVTIRLSCNPAHAFVDVSDSSTGIPAPALSRIFDRFYRVDKQLSGRRTGAGLGLSLAQWIATLHGGRILVKSRLGEGSTFTLVLPRDSRAADNVSPKTTEAAPAVSGLSPDT